MPHKVLFAPEAIRDLSELYGFILRRSGEPSIAFNYLERIRSACLQLSDVPERGTRRNDLRPGLRTMGFERRATIAFEVTETDVRILRIAYGGRDMNRLHRQ